jgi:hypothetical protein
MKSGIYIENYPELKDKKFLSDLNFDEFVSTGNMQFNFKTSIRTLPVDAIDVGVYGTRRWYICSRGIIMYASDIYGFVGKTKISFYSKQVFPKDNCKFHLYFLPWNKISQRRFKHVNFFNRRTIPRLKTALEWIQRDLDKAYAIYQNPLFQHDTLRDKAMYDEANDGVYVSEEEAILYIITRGYANKYRFVKWLSVEDYNRIIQELRQLAEK